MLFYIVHVYSRLEFIDSSFILPDGNLFDTEKLKFIAFLYEFFCLFDLLKANYKKEKWTYVKREVIYSRGTIITEPDRPPPRNINEIQTVSMQSSTNQTNQ